MMFANVKYMASWVENKQLISDYKHLAKTFYFVLIFLF